MAVSMKRTANTVVAFAKNGAAPLPPNTPPVTPDPPKVPASPVPFPDCNSTATIRESSQHRN